MTDEEISEAWQILDLARRNCKLVATYQDGKLNDVELQARYGLRRPISLAQWLGFFDWFANQTQWMLKVGFNRSWATADQLRRYQEYALTLRMLGVEPQRPINY